MFKKIKKNISVALSARRYRFYFLIFSIAFFILFGYLLGLEKLIGTDFLNNIVWELFLPNLFFIIVAGVLNGLLLTLTIFRINELQLNLGAGENKASIFSFGFASLFAACPFCAISIASVFGVSFVANFIAPYYLEFQLISILITLAALGWTSSKIGEECETCKIDYSKPKSN